MSDERVVPFHCPYCGEEDLRPSEHGPHGTWECRTCARAFTVKFVGLVPRKAATSS
jgi:ribosomal protein L37AE/L43A